MPVFGPCRLGQLTVDRNGSATSLAGEGTSSVKKVPYVADRRLYRVSCARTRAFAGYETTSTALTFAVALLARHPEAEQKLVAEIDALGGRCHATRHQAVTNEGARAQCGR